MLYQITAGNVLEFNVTHSAPLASDVSVSGMEGITSAYNLQTALGNVDHPAAVHGTDVGSRTLPAQAYYADVRVEDGQVTEISNLKAVDRPVIGISWKSDKIGSDYEGFAEAYERNGAYAVFLPQVTDAQGARNVLASLDGIFMTGGEDWGTELYGEEVTPHGASGVNEARDTSDIAYMQQAVKMGVPLFAVCRGEQGFNIAMGGGLIQDIPYYFGQKIIRGEMSATRISSVLTGKIPTTARDYTELPEELKEASGEDKDHPDNPCLRVTIDGVVHSGGLGYHKLAPGQSNSQVAIDPGSKLHEILGVDSISTVATAHHQAVNPDRLGDNLKIVARSSDGIVEGLEYTGKDENGKDTFALAVQWHPERDALRDTRGVNVDQDTCNVLLRALVTEAQKHDSATTTDTTTTVTNPDGSSVTTTTTASGIVGETVKDRNGTITSAKATIPAAVAVGLVRIPVDTEPGTPVSITITGGGSAYIAIPTASPNSGTVAVNGDGSVIRDGVVLDGCVVIRVTDSASVTIRNNSKQFTDSASHWAADSINFIAARDLFRGTGDGTTFSPDMQMNRGMLVTVLYRLANEPEGGTATFTDVPAGQYYTDAVAWAGTNQVVNGTGDGTFAPLQNITREQLATILYRYADASSTGTSIGGYADASSVSSWAVDAMNWAVNTGLVTGVSGNRLNPQGLASRAEVATIFMRFITSLVR